MLYLHSRAWQFNEYSGPASDWKIGVEIFHLATVLTHIQWIVEALSMRVKWLGNGVTHSQLVELKKDQNCTSTRMQRLIVECSAQLLIFIVPFISPPPYLKANSDKQIILLLTVFINYFLLPPPSLAQCYKMCTGISFKVYCGSFCTRSSVRLAVKYSVVTFKLPPVKLLRRKR